MEILDRLGIDFYCTEAREGSQGLAGVPLSKRLVSANSNDRKHPCQMLPKLISPSCSEDYRDSEKLAFIYQLET